MGKHDAKELKVRRSYELDRMAEQYLLEAYEQLVPTQRYPIVKNAVERCEGQQEMLLKKGDR